MTTTDQIKQALQAWPSLANNLVQEDQRCVVTLPLDAWHAVSQRVKQTFPEGRVGNYFATDERQTRRGFGIYVIWCLDQQHTALILHSLIPQDIPQFESLADVFPGAARYERDMWDFFGVIPINHPELKSVIAHTDWPKDFFPLRKDVPWNAPLERKPDDRPYPFKRYEGEGVYEIPVGPIHAGVIEPGHFRFQVAGEPIQNLEIRLGWKHRGVEKLFEHIPQNKWVHLSEQVSGDNSVAHSLGLCLAVEDASDISAPERAQWIRMIFLELERINMHLHDLANMNVGIGCNFGASQLWRLREQLFELNQKLTGSRFLRGTHVLGGVSQDLDQKMQQLLISTLKRVAADMNDTLNIVLNMPSALDRLATTGILKTNIAKDLGVVGVAARASGISLDSRKDFPNLNYQHVRFRVPVKSEGDVLARFLIRREELLESIGIIEQCLEQMAPGDLKAQVDLKPNALGWSVVESNRGELQYVLMTDSQAQISRLKIRDAAFHNWDALAWCVLGNIVPDFPLCNKSFNLSYAGHDL